MNRSFSTKRTNVQLHPYELSKKTAIHEAGHAAAIYISNKEKQLPPIFFQIFIKELIGDVHSDRSRFCSSQSHFYASIEGGRLIHILPSSIQEATSYFSPSEKQAYQNAFEADIMNLLVGPLAEAKYVALRDNELMNPRLIDLNALHYYGGMSDLKTANEYLDCLLSDPEQKEKKIAELFIAAYRFINHPAYWRAITGLADYILNAGKKVIECEEAIAVLDAKLA
ncbi:MAG: hypothetical protein ACXWUC_08465 [Methylosarcina sp.]